MTSLMALLALSTNVLVGDYDNHVANVKKQRPYETDKVEKVKVLASDMVLHYDKVVILGTTEEYAEVSKIWHFDAFLDAADKFCDDIHLVDCINELVCEQKIFHNLDTRRMECK